MVEPDTRLNWPTSPIQPSKFNSHLVESHWYQRTPLR